LGGQDDTVRVLLYSGSVHKKKRKKKEKKTTQRSEGAIDEAKTALRVGRWSWGFSRTENSPPRTNPRENKSLPLLR